MAHGREIIHLSHRRRLRTGAVRASLVRICAVLSLSVAPLATGLPNAFAADKSCDRALELALTSRWQVNDWPSLRDFWRSYHGCDGGAVAEIYSDKVAEFLAENWDRLPNLNSLVRRDSSFRAFIFAHIDSSADLKDLKAVRDNAKKRCPDRLRPLCEDVFSAADAAVKEAKDLRDSEPRSRRKRMRKILNQASRGV